MVELDDGLPPEADEVGTTRLILARSLALFADQGYHGTSIRAIGDAVGIRSATLYDHYPAKANILARLVALGYQDVAERLAAALADAGEDHLERAATLVRSLVTTNAHRPLLARVTTDELRRVPEALAAPAMEHRRRAEVMALQVCVDGQAAGVFQVANVAVVIAAIGGLAMRVPFWFTPTPGHGIDELADEYAELGLRMLGVVPSGGG